jgi:DNA (cytosine-5)-methyltransferase 1
MTVAYNENDPFAAAWLSNLVSGKVLPHGRVVTDSIERLPGTRAFADCVEVHLFAGIGGWPWALWLAGWPAGEQVWTGSCPCQPFSIAGEGKGVDDERHLWPAMRDLVEEHRPTSIFGEQVASPDGREWLSGVRTDLEALGYEVGAADLCAAGVAAPHIRQRLYWAARLGDTQSDGRQQRGTEPDGRGFAGTGKQDRGLAHARGFAECEPGCFVPPFADGGQTWNDARFGCVSGNGVGNAHDSGSQGRAVLPERRDERFAGPSGVGYWDAYDIVECREGDEIRFRRTEPGTFPLADGFPGRVGLLRGYGNAIVPELAARFVCVCVWTSGECAIE